MPIAARILSVDDNPRNLAILRKILAREFDFITAESGERGIELAVRTKPDLVLLDIMLPGLDGYETCRRMRQYPALAATKIIMVSAKTLTSDRLQGYAAGADDYISKPFDPDELLAKVRVYVRLKSVEEVDRIKSDLLALLAHETRTPLTFILSPISLLLESPRLTESERGLALTIDTGARRLQSLIEKVSFITELKSGAISFRTRAEDLAAIAGAAVERARKKAEASGAVVALTAGTAVPIEADRTHLEWLLDALLDNAVRLSPAGETITVRAWIADGRAGASVSDRGPGIPPEFLPHVFDELVTREIEHHSGGHGLSLATARLIAERHGGELSAASEPGRGATFTLDLPASSSAPPIPTPGEAPAHSPGR